MSVNESQFLDQLAGDLKPQRYWSPRWRAIGFLVALMAANFTVLLLEQGFRPGFVGELLSHPRFLIELLSVFSLISSLVYLAFASLVPGWRVSPYFRYFAWFSLAIFALSIYLSFGSDTPATTFAGGRIDCRGEVYLYSALGLIGFLFFSLRNPFPTHRFGYLFMGFASAVIPGAIMQVACAYSPMHSLDHHYGPGLLVAVIFGAALPFLRSRQL